jgi:hypothetical protein
MTEAAQALVRWWADNQIETFRRGVDGLAESAEWCGATKEDTENAEATIVVLLTTISQIAGGEK